MSHLATIAFSSTTKTSKARAMEIIEAFAANASDDELKPLAELYNYFKPSLPAKPKTSAQWVAKAAAKKDVRYYLNRLQVESGKLIACDGHRLHMCATDLADGAYDTQFNAIAATDAGKYPDWSRVIPTHNFSTRLADVKIIEHSTQIVTRTGDVIIGNFIDVSFNGDVVVKLNAKYWNDARIIFNDDAVVKFGGPNDSVVIEQGDKLAVIMPIRK